MKQERQDIKITVLLPCYNAEGTIRETLESIKWADEILVVDSFSTDKTLEICREYTDRILQHPYINSAAQKNRAIPQCEYEWVLQVDTDEVLDLGGEKEIREALKCQGQDVDAYEFRFKNLFYGKWLRYGGLYPDYHVRLFRRDKGKFQTKEVHARLIVPGRVKRMETHFIHNDFKGISSYLFKYERYMRYECGELLKAGRKFCWIDIVIKPFVVFLDRYFLKAGFRDGLHGFFYAHLVALYVFLKYVLLWETEWKKKTK
ncbi:MAG: glycosyltransferase family 2 protein [Candidatus Omnitrophica bacterium]|nr:glycosyltransferase family 2 protein [Candidatus Omnitrophota bacterium]